MTLSSNIECDFILMYLLVQQGIEDHNIPIVFDRRYELLFCSPWLNTMDCLLPFPVCTHYEPSL